MFDLPVPATARSFERSVGHRSRSESYGHAEKKLVGLVVQMLEIQPDPDSLCDAIFATGAENETVSRAFRVIDPVGFDPITVPSVPRPHIGEPTVSNPATEPADDPVSEPRFGAIQRSIRKDRLVLRTADESGRFDPHDGPIVDREIVSGEGSSTYAPRTIILAIALPGPDIGLSKIEVVLDEARFQTEIPFRRRVTFPVLSLRRNRCGSSQKTPCQSESNHPSPPVSP